MEEAVDGGAAVAWLVDGGSGRRRCGCSVCSLSLFPSPCFGSVFLFLFFFVFGFGFSILFSLSPACSLSLFGLLSHPLFLQKKSVLLSPSVSPFIEKKKHGAGMLFVRAFNYATAGRPLGRVRWRWGRGERRGRIFEIFSSSVLLKRGEGGR